MVLFITSRSITEITEVTHVVLPYENYLLFLVFEAVRLIICVITNDLLTYRQSWFLEVVHMWSVAFMLV